MRRVAPLTLTLLAALLAAGCCEKKSSETDTTVRNSQETLNTRFINTTESRDILTHLRGDLSGKALDHVIVGKSFFRIPWVEAPSATTARDGLGPLFSANTCIHCHPHNGAGRVYKESGSPHRSLLLRLSKRTAQTPEERAEVEKSGFVPDPVYGAQLSIDAVDPLPPEGRIEVTYETSAFRYPGGATATLHKPSYTITRLGYGPFHNETVFSARIAPSLIGLGHLEKIPQEALLSREDIADRDNDGISGKAQWVHSPETGKTELGRFTWKAAAASYRQQAAAAFHNDMGISNPLYPAHNCTDAQTECQKRGALSAHELDLTDERLDAVAAYLSALKVPLPKQIDQKGGELFEGIGCAKCHVPRHVTSEGIAIRPYTDLLLHDMGEALADDRTEFKAEGSEWRTAPLWGIGLKKRTAGAAHYLHDGRARSIEEAILWHGGEADSAKRAFVHLKQADRTRLLEFLETL